MTIKGCFLESWVTQKSIYNILYQHILYFIYYTSWIKKHFYSIHPKYSFMFRIVIWACPIRWDCLQNLIEEIAYRFSKLYEMMENRELKSYIAILIQYENKLCVQNCVDWNIALLFICNFQNFYFTKVFINEQPVANGWIQHICSICNI